MSNLPDDSFRDTIATINAEGKRNFIHPKKPSGPFYEKRKVTLVSPKLEVIRILG